MAKVNRPKSPSPVRPTPNTKPATMEKSKERPGDGAPARSLSAPTPGMFGRRGDYLIFNKQNYFWGLIGVGLIALGLILMLGGGMPNPDMWDDKIIYSFRIVTLAPLLIVAGLVVEIYAIFKKA